MGVLATVLLGVLKSLEAAEIDRRLDVSWIASNSTSAKDDGNWCSLGRLGKWRCQSLSMDVGRLQAPGDVPHILARQGKILADSREAVSKSHILRQVTCQLDTHIHREQFLLKAVVKITVDASPLSFRGGRRFRSWVAQVFGRCLQVSLEPSLVHRGTNDARARVRQF